MRIGNENISSVKLGAADVDLYLGDELLYKGLESSEQPEGTPSTEG
jgi:hypothetical protein